MVGKIWIAFILSMAGVTTLAWFFAFLRDKGIRPERGLADFIGEQPGLGRAVFVALFVGMCMYAGSKSAGGGGGSGGGNTNDVQMVQNPAGIGGGGGLLQMGGFRGSSLPITSTNTTRTLDLEDFGRGFVMSRIGTDEVFDFVPASNAVVCADWMAFGAAEDWIYLALGDWAFSLGTNGVDRLRVFSSGRVDPIPPATNRWFAPLNTAIGIAPLADWGLTPSLVAGVGTMRSQFWHLVTPSNTLQLTWQNVFLGRAAASPICFQMEMWPNGRFAYRYDFSQLDGGTVSNVLAGAFIDGGVWTTNAIPHGVTSIAFHPLSAEDASHPDKDGDGLATIDEIFVYGTDPALFDTDDDGLSDLEEVQAGTDPWKPDTDGDGLYDVEEVELGTNPLSADSDSDGVSDGEELHLRGTDPLLSDTDGDGLPDVVEIAGESDPTKADTDGDGLDDAEEIDVGTDPLNPDSDGDGAFDGWEVENLSDPLDVDTDGDGLLDGTEMRLGSSPILVDTDGDGFDDFEEFAETGTSPALADTDGDGLSDWLEVDRMAVLASNAWVEVAIASVRQLFSAPSDGILDDDIVTTDLPLNIDIRGVVYDRVSVDTNGKIHLIPTNGVSVTSYFYENQDPAEMPFGAGDIVVAPYWDDLVLRSNLSSFVRIGADPSGEHVVLDYVAMGLYSGGDTNSSVTCQVVLSSDANYPIRINYRSVASEMTGGSATIGVLNRGMQSFRNRGQCQSLVWSCNLDNTVCAGLSLGFRPGVGTDPLNADTDGDGLDDGDEFALGTDPMDSDTDGDGLGDGAEIASGASPFMSDTDGDGMPDAWEVRYGLNPDYDGDALHDTDYDHLTNFQECQIGSSPLDRDTDGDGRDDYTEWNYGTSPIHVDTDGDGLDDLDEWQRGTAGTDPDTDGDGMSDGWEVVNNFNPRSDDAVSGASRDPDGDGLTNAEEFVLGTNPRLADTDGDGLDDGEEVGCFRRRYAQEGEWASATNGWSAVEIVNEEGFNLYWFTIWDGTLRIGNEEVFDVYCQWNGLVLVGSDICYPEDAVWLSPVDLAGAFVSEAALAIAPYWSEELADSVAPAVSVFERGEGGNVSFAIQYAALPAGGTNTVSFQVTLVFTNGVYKATEILYGADSSAGLDGLNASIGVQDTIKSVKWSAGFHQLASLNPLRVMQFVQGAGTDPLDEVVDSDGDGLSDDLELIIGTDPHQPDTDGDGMHDGWECAYSFNPLEDNDDASIDADSDNDSCADPDEDGLTNKEEADWGTDPYDEDTDADGVPDGEEVENSSDPNDETDGGCPASRVPVDFTFGDPSGSHSEKYRLVVKPVKDPDGRKPVSGEEPKTFSWVDAEYGECETKTAMLQRGWTYEVRMFHAGTNIEDGDPDYDYSLTCSPPSCVGVVTADPEGLFQSFDDTSDYFSGKSKVAHILVLDGCLVGDYDRKDGFTDYDLSRVYRNKPLRHWINDDDDSGDTNDSDHDTPGAPGMPRQKPTATLPGRPVMPGSEEPFSVPYLVADWSNDHVDGKCDILDFTPVWMDMGVALQQLSRFSGNGGFELYLSCDEGSVNVVWTSLTTNNVSVFLTNAVSGCGRNLDKSLETAGTVHLTDKETKVPDVFLAAMRDDRRNGVFLFEGCKVDGKDIATSPIVLRCYKKPRASDAQPLFELKLPLSISPVEDMFRWKSFRSAAGEEGLKTPDRTGSPVNFPDTETNGKNLLFLHGANVSEENARAWMSETFKRFRQSGCAAKFHGVTWRSNIGNGANYQEDVSNAFVTAQWVAGYASTVGGKKVFAAHSLGNVVVSSALADWNMAADAYFMCNAAVTSEALDPEASTDSRLVHADWAKYPASLYSCNWFRNFSDNDSRHRLTWNGRFTNILDRVYNLYSSGDHCFELFSKGNPHFWSGLFSVDYFAERYCWQKQELGKGCLPSAQVLGKTEWAGWGFDKNWKGSKKKRPVPVDGEVIPPDELAQYPAFRLYPAWMNSPNLSSLQINSMLAQGIPTITPAVGNTLLNQRIFPFQKQVQENLESSSFKPNGWPNRGREWQTRWLHGDMKDTAYYYSFMLYHFVVNQGELK